MTMSPKAALQRESTISPDAVTENVVRTPAPVSQISQRLPNVLAGTARTVAPVPAPTPLARPRRENSAHFQARIPVITGEAVYRGAMPVVDGLISGHLGATGSTLTIKQRPRSGPVEAKPELDGELTFKDMLRVNGFIAGKVTSVRGTLFVDPSARVDADIDVGVAVISGVVNGDVIAHERVELGPAAIINGNIATRSLTMKPGAVFQGDCRMLKD
jgi:hypothetical protein